MRMEKTFDALRGPEEALGIPRGNFKIRQCNNHCCFCFVDQMPPGLRETLYIKDDDFRLSFLHGAYITATNISRTDTERIFKYRISPLYFSVHATDQGVRNKLLGNPRAPDITGFLRLCADTGIRFHTQIVCCPGINDGAVLRKTIRDLARFFPKLLSIAVVPVGLTRHRKGLPFISPVSKRIARRILAIVHTGQKEIRLSRGRNFLYAADELYIQAGLPLPRLNHYGDFPQLENGVGMLRSFLAAMTTLIKTIPRRKSIRRRIGIVTGVSAATFLRPLFSSLSARTGDVYRIIEVRNQLLGPQVTVTGLLGGADITAAIRPFQAKLDCVYLPPNCLNQDNLTLDGYTAKRLSLLAGLPVKPLNDLKELA